MEENYTLCRICFPIILGGRGWLVYYGVHRVLYSISMVSFETISDSKQPKLEPKLVSALSETKCLFQLFRFYTETESFDVSIEPKQTEDPPKQFDNDREHILPFFTENLGFFRFFSSFSSFFLVCF
jgi:hypothetical protein